MRTIKFRAWDLDNHGMWYSGGDRDDGEWGKDWYVTVEGSIAFCEYQMRDLCEGGEHVQREDWHTPNQALMQFTGLHDKNGKEIYEGDVIKCNYCAKDHGEVYWNKSGADFRIRWKDDCCANARLTRIDNWCAVIGNIYENPELITNP